MADVIDNCPAWPNADQSLPPWPVPADDPDCDNWSTAAENYIGTDGLTSCDNISGPPDWPADFDDNRVVNIFDILSLAPYLGTYAASLGWSQRHDLDTNGVNNAFDILRLAPTIGFSCAAP